MTALSSMPRGHNGTTQRDNTTGQHNGTTQRDNTTGQHNGTTQRDNTTERQSKKGHHILFWSAQGGEEYRRSTREEGLQVELEGERIGEEDVFVVGDGRFIVVGGDVLSPYKVTRVN